MKGSKHKIQSNLSIAEESAADSTENSAEISDGKKEKKRKSIRFKRLTPTTPPPVVHIDNRSFLALLIRSFVSFMVISVLSVVLIFVLALWATDNGRINLIGRTFSDYHEYLESGNFSAIPIRRICGDTGWLNIVDMQGNFVYSSDGEERAFTRTELDCIHDYGSPEIITIQSFRMPNGDYHHLISRKITNDPDSNEQYLFLDADLRIISGSISTTKTQFTENELDLYTYNSRHEGIVIEKYHFTSGENGYYAVYLDTNNDEGVTPYLFVIIMVVGIVGMLVASLILYIRYINKHVQRPLKALGSAMTDFAKNGYREKLDYSGTQEFEQLVDSFNEMVALLDASEAHRNMLEQDRHRMLAGLSHDLKTPITIIQGFSKAIRDGLVDEEDKQKYLNLIINKSENMGSLINELYEYSKLEHPDFKLNVEDTDVAELARTYLAGRYDEFEISGYQLDADIPDDRVICDADKNQLTRVFENLTNNFFKYTPAGSTLYLRVFTEDGNAIIIFADDGGGISEDMYEDIFAPFVVGEQSRNKQGTGLGLAVCQKIITAHGGTIKLNRTPMENSTTEFDIVLPLKK